MNILIPDIALPPLGCLKYTWIRMPAPAIQSYFLIRDGSQPSVPLSTFLIVIFFASAFVNCFAHATRALVSPPGPVLPYSAYLTVFSRSGWFQLCQPAGF